MNENYNYGNYMNNGGYEGQYFTTAPQPPKKKAKTGTAIALALLVAVIGGASGFGGAYLASTMNVNGTPIYSEGAEPSGNPNLSDRDEAIKNSDVNAAISSIYASDETTADLKAKNNSGKVTPTGPNGTYTATELYEAVNDTIVLINIYKDTSSTYSDYYYNNYFFGYGQEPEQKKSEPVYYGYGSGIVFTEDGYILTNAHVVDGAAKLEVVVNDYKDSTVTHKYEAKVIGSDTHTDVAIIKIERKEAFRAATIGDSDTLKVGQDVCVIGNPGVSGDIMFTHTMTKGIISGLNRVSLSNGYSTSSIQIDAAINSGNSGGALFDMYGNVVGIVNKKIVVSDIENIGFAITINEAKPIMEDLLSFGYVKSRPVLGITTTELNEYYAQKYRTKLSKGLLVNSIREGSAAVKSGLRENDIITKINGKNVETVSDVQSIIKNMKPGDKVTATVAREKENGKLESVEIEIELSDNSVNE